jgi:hypothetical protein
MKPRKIMIPLLATIATIILIATFSVLEPVGSEEARYERCVWTMRVAGGLKRNSMQLPTFLARPLGYIGLKLWDKAADQERSLFASGYLTNISINLLKASALSDSAPRPTIDEVSRCVHNAVPDNRYLPCSLNSESHRVWVEVSCRTQDVARIEKALSSYYNGVV